MAAADSWNFTSSAKAYRATGGWGDRPRYAPADFVALLWRERWLMIAVFVVLFAAGIGFAFTLKTTYTAYSSILVRLGDEYVYQPRAGDAGRGAVPESDAVIAAETEILGSSQLKERVIQRVGLNVLYPKIKGDNPDQALAKGVQAFEKSFQIGTAPDVPTIKLSFEHEDSSIAARTLNALMDEYLIYRRQVLIDSRAPALKTQRESSQAKLEVTNSEFQNFLSFNDIGDFDSEKTAMSRYTPDSSPVRELDRQIAQLERSMATMPTPGDAARRMGPNPVYQTLNTERIQVTAEVAALRQQLAATVEQIRQVTDRQLRLVQLEPQFQKYNDERSILQGNVKDFTTREQESLAQAAIAASGGDNIRIVSRATPPVQGASSKKLVAAAAMLLAGFMALGVGLLTMFLRGGLVTPASAARTLGLPVLATAGVKR